MRLCAATLVRNRIVPIIVLSLSAALSILADNRRWFSLNLSMPEEVTTTATPPPHAVRFYKSRATDARFFLGTLYAHEVVRLTNMTWGY